MGGNIEVSALSPGIVALAYGAHPSPTLLQRLAARLAATGGDSVLLFDIVGAEVADGTASGNSSCTKGLLWLKRFLEFTLRLLEQLAQNEEGELGDAARAAYDATLRPFHGYLTQAVFTAVLYATPYRATFEAALLKHDVTAGEDASPAPAAASQALADDIAQFVAAFAPVLARIHAHLAEAGQDDPARV